MSTNKRIIIVGAGPAGLTAAVLLRQRGYEPIVLDRRPNMDKQLPAAHVVNTRSQEVFGELGIADIVCEKGDESTMSSLVVWVESMAGREYGRLPILESAKDERGPLSIFRSVNIPQTELEPILRERFEALGGHVRFGEKVTDVQIVGDKAQVTTRAQATGTSSVLESDWVLGCDGAGSKVRRSLGIEMEGPPTIERFMTLYFRADLDRYRQGREGLLYWIGGQDVRGVFISFDKIGRTWAMLVPIGDLALDNFDDDDARAILHKAIGDKDVEIELVGVSQWNMSAQVAKTFRRGPVLLAGDACHRFPPTGGLGMNTGIQDAHNLIWKLAAVIEGRAPITLLDSYEQERRPIAQRNTDQSVSNLMRMAQIDEALGIPTLTPIAANAGDGPIAAYPEDTMGIDGETLHARARRKKVQAAIDAQIEHFAQGAGIDLGFSYSEGAFIPDGSSAPSTGPMHYRPDAHPGARLPHVPVHGDGFEGSTLGLVAAEGITLFATDARWVSIARQASSETDLPIKTIELGQCGATKAAQIADFLGISDGGAVVTRPDGHVLWRATAWPDDPLAQLAHAARVCHGLGAVPAVQAGTC